MALTKVRGAGAEGLTLSTTDLKIDAGDLVFSTADKGVVLGATSNTDANTIGDYEEGTWTPSLNAYGGTPTISDALYTKIGRYVFATCRVALDGTSDASTFQILGLPFTSFASSAAIFGANVIYANSSTAPTYGLIGASGTTATFYSSSGSNLSYNGAGNDKSFRINLHYFST